MTTLEREARRAWSGGAVRGPMHGYCDDCHRNRDDDGKPLMVARQRGSRKFLCVYCWSLRSSR